MGLGLFIASLPWIGKKIPPSHLWIVFAASGVFFIAGLQISFQFKGRASDFIGGLLFACFSAIGFFVAFTDEPLRGGIPFIPASWNQTFGHGLFGFGAVLTGAAAIYAFRRALRSARRE